MDELWVCTDAQCKIHTLAELEGWRRCLFWRGRSAERASKNVPADTRNPWSHENLRNLKYVCLLESLLLVLKNSLFWHADKNSPCSACEELRERNIMDLIKETTELQATFSSDVLVVTLRLSYSLFFNILGYKRTGVFCPNRNPNPAYRTINCNHRGGSKRPL